MWPCFSFGARRDLISKEFRRRDEVTDAESTVKLEQFEVAALSNIEPGDVEEATTLIPSLERFQEEEIEEILEVINQFRDKAA